MRKKIELDDTFQDIMVKMSEGNPGGLDVLMRLVEDDPTHGIGYILDLDAMNIRGTQIWIGYKDYCGQDIEMFKECCRERDQEMVNVINEQGQLGNHDEIAKTNRLS